MKVAILADIHANFVALEEIAAHIDHWQPDAVLVNGDTVNRGPRPRECWDFVRHRRTHGQPPWIITKGNHEEYVIAQGIPRPDLSSTEKQLFRPSEWAYEQLGASDVAELDALPVALQLSAHGEWQLIDAPQPIARCTHGSMLGMRDGIYTHTPDETLRQQIGPHCPALFAVGHTHQPLIRRVDGITVVNVGSVGLPFDGDWRACYAQLIWRHNEWHATIIRHTYDRDRAARDFESYGFLQNGGPLSRLILRELRVARGQLHTFFQNYEKPILAGTITLAQAVDAYLDACS